VATIGGAAVVLMAFAQLFERPGAIAAALLALGAEYGLSLELEGARLDRAAYTYAVLYLVAAELAYWSLEMVVVRPAPGILLRRLASLLLVAVAGFVAAFLVLAASRFGAGGSALVASGVTAALAALGILALLARRARPEPSNTTAE
jgi:hypothetical protein